MALPCLGLSKGSPVDSRLTSISLCKARIDVCTRLSALSCLALGVQVASLGGMLAVRGPWPSLEAGNMINHSFD